MPDSKEGSEDQQPDHIYDHSPSNRTGEACHEGT